MEFDPVENSAEIVAITHMIVNVLRSHNVSVPLGLYALKYAELWLSTSEYGKDKVGK